MTERQTGLRFDIYERVHLAEDTVGMRELDEVELVPHIQVYTEGEQAVLKGHLYLTGQYEGETGDESRTLEHLIPVEITLPLNRIQDVNEVAVNIDNFDVDLLSPRSLNVTGVLTLHGIEMLSAPDEEWREEETVFVHEAPAYQAQEEAPAVRYGDITPAQAAEEAAAQPAWFERQPYAFDAGTVAEPERREEPSAVSEYYVDADNESEVEETFYLEEEAQPAVADEEAIAVPETIPEDKKEMKIAFGSRPGSDTSNYLKSMIHTRESQESLGAVAAVQTEEPDSSAPRTDALEWKRLFVSAQEEQTFKSVRLCIVQKDETIDSISKRYNISAREILLYNRIAEQDLMEGKVLFIPR